MWWDGENGLTFGLKRAGRRWRRLVVRFHVFVIKIPVEHHLIPEDFVLSGHITAVAFAFGEGRSGHIEVKPR